MDEFDYPGSFRDVPCCVCPRSGECVTLKGCVEFEETNWFPIFDCTTTEESSS